MATIENNQGKRVVRISSREMFGPTHTQNVGMVLAAFTVDGKTTKEHPDDGPVIYKWEFPGNMTEDVIKLALDRLEIKI